MNHKLPELVDTQHLDEVLTESRDLPVLLFKHSHTCGTSYEALDEVLAHMADRAGGVRYAMVTVQRNRELSNAVSSRLGIRHQTPQAILVRDGRAVWSASHFSITAASLERALQNVSES